MAHPLLKGHARSVGRAREWFSLPMNLGRESRDARSGRRVGRGRHCARGTLYLSKEPFCIHAHIASPSSSSAATAARINGKLSLQPSRLTLRVRSPYSLLNLTRLVFSQGHFPAPLRVIRDDGEPGIPRAIILALRSHSCHLAEKRRRA